MSPIPADLEASVERMTLAAVEWLESHPGAVIHFRDLYAEIARRAGVPGKRIAPVGLLWQVIDHWAGTPATRDLLHALERAGTTGHKRPTILMANIVVVRVQRVLVSLPLLSPRRPS